MSIREVGQTVWLEITSNESTTEDDTHNGATDDGATDGNRWHSGLSSHRRGWDFSMMTTTVLVWLP